MINIKNVEGQSANVFVTAEVEKDNEIYFFEQEICRYAIGFDGDITCTLNGEELLGYETLFNHAELGDIRDVLREFGENYPH